MCREEGNQKVCQEEGEGGGKQEVVIELYTLTTKIMRRPKITSWRCYATIIIFNNI